MMNESKSAKTKKQNLVFLFTTYLLTNSKFNWRSLFGVFLLLSGAIFCSTTAAQILPDNTLGAETSTVRQDNIQGLPSDVIEGGATRGANLFHSFSEFNIEEGRGAYFANPEGIANILSRVTGSNASNILGTLGVLGNANLFFINPNGIIFGSNASLDLKGSFVGSTADSLVFENGFEFSASNPQVPPLLTVNIPIGLGFRDNQTGILVNTGNLEVGQQHNLTLLGGTVISTGQLYAPGGNVSLAAIPEANLVQLGAKGQLQSWEKSLTSDASDTKTSNLSLLELLSPVGDDLGLEAISEEQVKLGESGINFTVTPGTTVVSGTLDASNIEQGQTGGQIVVLGERVGLLDGAQIDVSGHSGGGTVLIGGDFQGNGEVPNASYTFVSNGSIITADAFDSGNGGRVIVWGDKGSRFYGNINARGGVNSGNGGFVEVSSPQVLDFKGKVDTSASHGETGTLILDPTNIEVVESLDAETSDLSEVDEFSNPDLGDDENTKIDAFALAFASSNVILQATNDITFDASVFMFTPGLGITAEAGNNIIVNNSLNTSGGEVQLIAENNISFTNSFASISTSGGNVALNAEGNVSLEGADIFTGLDSSVGGSGDIQVKSRALSMKNGASLATTNFFSAEKAGDLTIETGQLILQEESQMRTGPISMNSLGAAGDLTILASDSVEVRQKSGIAANTFGTGEGGNLTIETGRLIIQDSNVSVSSSGAGNSGNIVIDASESVELLNVMAAIQAQANDTGDGGAITIKTPRLTLQNGGAISVATQGNAKAGEVIVNASESVELIGGNSIIPSGIISITSGSKPAGDIKINTEQLIVRDDAFMTTLTAGDGAAGDLTINTGQLIVQEGIISTETFGGAGAAGDLTIQASDSVVVNGTGESLITTVVNEDTTGNGGNLAITTRQLTVQNGAQIQAGTFGEGSSGKLTVTASDFVELTGNGSGLFTQTDGNGNSNDLTIKTRELIIKDRARISASTTGEGNAGQISLTADTVELTENGAIQSKTDSIGQAGNITLNIRDSLNLTDSSIEASTTSNSSGNGGSIIIDPVSVNLNDNAAIAVNSEGKGNGGSIKISADNLSLNDNSEISAATASGEGGNIDLAISKDIIFKNNSLISARAFSKANGGNVTINADNGSIVAFPNQNNDIIANAQQGNGGNIDITTQAIFGLEERPSTPPNQTNDIDASSEFGLQGSFSLNTPENEPSRGLVELPENVVNPEDLISQNACKQGGQSKFTLTGRGGLPATPDRVHSSDEVEVDLVKPARGVAAISNEIPVAEDSTKLVPAKGWIRNERGEIFLVGYDPTQSNIPSSQPGNLSLCQPQ